MADASVSAAFLRAVLDYDQETGFFHWKVAAKRIKSGQRADGRHSKGYLRIKLQGRFYFSHRLAWLYVTGEWPKGQIDHWNANRQDNRFKNLRDVTAQCNRQNMRQPLTTNRTGLIGVCAPTKSTRKYRAMIGHNNKNILLGSFDTPEAAQAAYLDAKRRLHAGCTI